MDIRRLESWYQNHHRKLSFRQTQDPYHIWVSEIMLQQTQVETVLPYFDKFIMKYPSIIDLADADEEILHRDVEGLGYYRRFKNMHQAAKLIKLNHQGIFPKTYEEVLALPGIGRYTAGAIMSIAYKKPFSALDGNVIRVLSRYLGNGLDMREEKNKKILDQYNQYQIENSNPEIYTQAMMELGATICRPKQPKCELCPLQEHCFAYHQQETHLYPNLSRLKEKQIESYMTFIIHHEKGIILRKRTENLLNGMYEYPQYESESLGNVLSSLEEKGIYLNPLTDESIVQHVFTHRVWIMHVYHCHIKGQLDPEWICVDQNEIKKLPMAIAHRKITFI